MTEENWGSLSPLEGTTQITRSMLDMLNAKPYNLAEEDKELNIQEETSSYRDGAVPQHTLQSIKLADYVADAEQVLASNNLFSNLTFPSFDEPALHRSDLRKNSVNNSNGVDMKTVDNCATRGVAAICASQGFGMSTTSAMRVLTDVTQQYIETFCKSLRQTLDNEALTGQTGFFDSVDQVCHDMNISGIKELTDFYKENVLDHHKKLLNKSSKLQEKIETLKQQPRTRFPVKVKQETTVQGGWTPIASIDEQNSAHTSTKWKPFVKNELNNPVQPDKFMSPGKSSWQKDNVKTSNVFAQPSPTQDYFRIKKQRFGN